MTKKFLFTSEQVSEGHPDKIADQIADAILDDILSRDSNARVACEVSVTKGLIFIFGEISTTTYADVQAIARRTLREVGYTAENGLDPETIGILTAINQQSADIALGVDSALDKIVGEDEIGAGDQGLIFGYATNETPEYMPATIVYANKIMARLQYVRHNNIVDYLGPDAKTQVTLEYVDNKVNRVDTIVLSTQHRADTSLEQVRADMVDKVIHECGIPEELLKDTKILVNPTGRFVVGGPTADSGLTGRKLITDTYGGWAHHGGGSMITKDPTKVDRSAAYITRYIAKNIVAAGLADRVEIQLAYAIGVAHPVSVFVDTFGTGKLSDEEIIDIIKSHFKLTPQGIINSLGLQRPIYRQIAAGGQFGRDDVSLPWEQLDKVDELQEYIK